MASTRLLEGSVSSLYSPQDTPHDRVDGVPLLRLSTKRVVGEAHRSDVLGAGELSCGVGQVANVRRDQVADFRRSWERKSCGPVVLAHLERELREHAAAAAQEDVRRQAVPAGELFEAQSEALEEHLGVGTEQLGHLAVLLGREQTLGVAKLASLRLFVAQAERPGQPAGEGAAAEVEHAGPLHPAI